MVASLVALRVGIGLHFYLEGTAKLQDPKPFSGGFFANAKGPLAPLYRNLVWDLDGKQRLDPQGGATKAHWEAYGKRVAAHFRFDDKQTKNADEIVKAHLKRMGSYLGSKKEDINEYFLQVKRRDLNRDDPVRQGLAAMQAHDARIAADRNQKLGPMLGEVEQIWKNLENDLNSIATAEQWKRHGRLPIGKVGRQALDSEFMDAVVPYFDTAIGLLLIMGLFTRVAGIAGGLFLASVCASQWPGYGGQPIYYQFVEMLALFALAAIGAGQFCGLDYVVTGLLKLYRPAKPTAGQPPATKQVTAANQPASVLVPVKGAKA